MTACIPQGLKPESLLVLGGTAQAVPFPIVPVPDRCPSGRTLPGRCSSYGIPEGIPWYESRSFVQSGKL